MSKVLVIPDIHLKPYIFDIADKIINNNEIDQIVFLGDLIDEFHQSNNINLYKETIDKAIEFKHQHINTLYCWGNHEIAYLSNWNCSGNSIVHNFEIKHMLNLYEREVNPKFVYYIDNYLFSHAGISNRFANLLDNNSNINDLIEFINKLNFNDAGVYDSPIWLRPNKFKNTYYNKYIQIIGHTPVKSPSFINNTWILDTFSLDPNTMKSYGDKSIIVIDTKTNDIFIYYNAELKIKLSKNDWINYTY